MNAPTPARALTPRRRRIRRLARRWAWISLFGALVALLAANRWVINSTDAYVYTNWALMPENEVGLVLGTSAYLRGGDPSPDFHGRIAAAVELVQLRKVKHLIVSGANPDATYNEPRRMWQELTKLGVPPEQITMDFAGFRTLDSIARAQQIFRLTRLTVVTQKYHAYRAVFLGKKTGLDTVAYVAPGTSFRHPVREVFARLRAVLDLFLLKTRPRFLGKPEALTQPPPGEEIPAEEIPEVPPEEEHVT